MLRRHVVVRVPELNTDVPELNSRGEELRRVGVTQVLDRSVTNARAVTQEVAGERRWILAWQLDDLEQEQKRDLGRER